MGAESCLTYCFTSFRSNRCVQLRMSIIVTTECRKSARDKAFALVSLTKGWSCNAMEAHLVSVEVVHTGGLTCSLRRRYTSLLVIILNTH